MPVYKLHYFALRGRAEPARLILNYRGIPFEDVRIPREEWPQRKADYPNGQMPLLEVDGAKISQSNAITRFLARRYNLAGATDVEGAQIDETAELFRDFMDGCVAYLRTAGGMIPGDKDELRASKFVPACDKFLPQFEAILEKAGSGFYAPSGLSYADFVIAEPLRSALLVEPKILDNYPRMKAQLAKVDAIPELQKYFKSRPQTPF